MVRKQMGLPHRWPITLNYSVCYFSLESETEICMGVRGLESKSAGKFLQGFDKKGLLVKRTSY
jgi:hypothetical protein